MATISKRAESDSGLLNALNGPTTSSLSLPSFGKLETALWTLSYPLKPPTPTKLIAFFG
jgi:hypothetical protein